MGCQSEVYLGDWLTFTICTHDPDTGESMDAGAPPTYRVYEDETGAAIMSGTMTLLDDPNTVGFYSERVECSLAHGFEAGRSYNVYIRAVVDAHPGAISYGFRALESLPYAVWNYAPRTLTQSAAAILSAVSGSDITFTRGVKNVITLTGLTFDPTRTYAYFSMKIDQEDLDTESIVMIREGAGGLLTLNGAPGAATQGTLVVAGVAPNQAATVTLKGLASSCLLVRAGLVYGLKQIVPAEPDPYMVTYGAAAVAYDIPRAIT